MASTLEGEWDANTRVFLTSEEKYKKEKFGFLEDTITASIPAFISKDHQRTSAAEGDDVESVDTRLSKGDEAHPSPQDWRRR